MVTHREDSIAEGNARKAEAENVASMVELALDCVAELGDLIAPLLEAQAGGEQNG